MEAEFDWFIWVSASEHPVDPVRCTEASARDRAQFLADEVGQPVSIYAMDRGDSVVGSFAEIHPSTARRQ